MKKEYITPCTDVLEIIIEEMIAASGVYSDDPVDIPFGGDPIENLDPESRIPFGNFIFGE